MRATAVVLLAAIFILGAHPPTLAQEGSFVDEFEVDSGQWSVVSGRSAWRVEDGSYVFDDPGWGRHMTVAPVQMADGAITVRATPLAESEAHGWASFGVLVKHRHSADLVAVRFGAYNNVSVYLQDGPERSFNTIGRLEAEVGREYEARLEVDGDTLRTFLDGEELDSISIGWDGVPGRVGLYTETPMACSRFEVEGALTTHEVAEQQIEGTPRPSVEFATFQPDPLLPGEAIPVRGHLHLYVRNSGDGPAVLSDVSIDGRDSGELIEAGEVGHFHQHPHSIRPGEVGRATLRISGLPEEQALTLMQESRSLPVEVELRHLKAEPVSFRAELGPGTEPLRINILTFSEDLSRVTAYVEATDPPEGGFVLEAVAVNGRDLTGSAQFGSRRVGEDIVPIVIPLDEPLTEGRHVTVTISTAQGVPCGHSLRAFPSIFPIQVCLFDQIRDDSIEDIFNHGFTAVAPRNPEFIPEMQRHGLDLLDFGMGLSAAMRWWRPDYPDLVAFWLDERDKWPVQETLRSLEEMHEYYRHEDRYVPRQMINLVRPWSASGMAFMDVLDVVCHGYGMAGANNGPDFPLLSSLEWRELRSARRPWWPYFRSAEMSVSVDPEERRVLEPAPNTQRVIEPEQERMMTYGCLQLGAKGIMHWAYGVRGDGERPVYYLDVPGLRLSMGGIPYPTSRMVRGFEIPEEICRALKDTWDEIGRINAELQTIGPWVADSDVSSLARVIRSEPAEAVTAGPAAQAAALVSGLDTIVLIALNLNIDTEWRGRDPDGIRSYDPVDTTVELRVPEWLEPTEVFSVDWHGIEDISSEREEGRLVFDLPGLGIQRVIVVTADPEVRARMERRLSGMQQRLQAMENHVPVPSREE